MNYEKLYSIVKGHPTTKGHLTYTFLMGFFKPKNIKNSKPDKTFSAQCKHGLHWKKQILTFTNWIERNT